MILSTLCNKYFIYIAAIVNTQEKHKHFEWILSH